MFADEEDVDTLPDAYGLREIQESGELICITLSGPDTYFEFRGKGFGLQNDLAEQFAHDIGVRMRMEVAHDTLEAIRRLKSGEVDILTLDMPETSGTLRCRNHWLVADQQADLSQSIDDWYRPEILEQIKKRPAAQHEVRRKPRPVMLNASTGQICQYDALLQQHASTIGWDWRLLAAQCYQESAFDPQAVSWAGAQGLMQIMPGTAEHLGVRGDIFDPATNIEASVRYLRELNSTFSDIPDQSSRIPFILAAYNGGVNHVRDAMALTQKHGGNEKIWRDVAAFILHLAEPQYYRDPVVKSGYLRGSETHSYVENIMDRWAEYRGQARNFSKASTPAPAKNPREKAEIRRPDISYD